MRTPLRERASQAAHSVVGFYSPANVTLAFLALVGLGAVAIGSWSLIPHPPTYVDPIPPQVAQQAISDWNSGNPSNATVPVPGGNYFPNLYPNPSSSPSPIPTPVAAPVAAPAPAGPSIGRLDYLLFRFPSLGEAAVAGNGDWSMLNYREAAHWYLSPAPGSAGNSLIAFHRGAAFAYASNLHAGDTITVQDRSGRTYTYKIQFTVVVNPQDATPYFDPINDGVAHLTMLTCDPYKVWNHRLVIRATLVA
jgi:LPXTG-site transpeptidase (sortase) family protein